MLRSLHRLAAIRRLAAILVTGPVTGMLLALSGPAHADGTHAGAPSVIASVPPIHSLVAQIMAGIGEPALLIPGTVSPHQFSLRPSDARALSHADIVVWVGPALETSLRQPLETLAGNAQLVTLTETPEIALYAVREGGVWGAHTHDDNHAHGDQHEEHADEPAQDVHAAQDGKHTADEHDEHQEGAAESAEIDAHIWLDTGNAATILRAVAATLIAHDPSHATAYAANRDAALRGLDTLAAQLRAQLDPVQAMPFVVLHDGYQYFERQFGLNAVGAISISPDISPGARRIGELRHAVRERHAHCIFSEPQLAAGPAQIVAEGSGAHLGVLDPIGAGFAPGPDLYGKLMTGLAAGFSECLAAGG